MIPRCARRLLWCCLERATSDRGVAMLRRFITRQVERVQRGEDPVGVAFDESDAVVDFSGGQFLLEADAVPVSPATAAG